jgi:ElaB/YqjD/DUF883 family membrane-anchored ribosome-binding protein
MPFGGNPISDTKGRIMQTDTKEQEAIDMAQLVQKLRQQIDELEDSFAHRARKAVRATDEAIQVHPYAAMGLAGLAGVVIGALVARAIDKSA